MVDRPISYSGTMVTALLREIYNPGTGKTQTRRILKLPRAGDKADEWQASTIGGPDVTDRKGNPVPEQPCIWHPSTGAVISPAHAIGDRLWVREAWRTPETFNRKPSDLVSSCREAGFSMPWCPIQFEADKGRVNWGEWREQEPGRLRAAMHLPRPYSRLTQAVTAVRIERLHSLSKEDAIAEGWPGEPGDMWPIDWYVDLWDQINGPGAWCKNPWVVATTFTTALHNIDAEPA